MKKNNSKRRIQGGFFKYLHLTKFDLSRYGIFKEVDKKNYIDNCLYLALKAGGLEADKLQQLKTYFLNRSIPLSKIGQICKDIGIQLKIHYLKPCGKKAPIKSVGEKSNPLYEIGLIDEHYFIFEKTDITSYCIKNYERLKDIDECNYIYNQRNNKITDKTKGVITSFELFKSLLENQETLLKPIKFSAEICSTQYYDKVIEYDTLEYPPESVKLTETFEDSDDELCEDEDEKDEIHDSNDDEFYYRVFADFETITEGSRHEPYCCAFIDEDKNKKTFEGEYCAVDMLDNLPDKKNILLIFHNMNYDCRFLLKYIRQPKVLVKGGRFLSIQGTYTSNKRTNSVKLNIKDSARMIPMKLKDFGATFGLQQEKEVMPYKLYTKENIEKRYMWSSGLVMNYVKEKDRQQFKDNIDKWGLRKNLNQYDIVQYALNYCMIDCEVLMNGYMKFREWIKEITKLDIDKYITLQSLANKFMIFSGCWSL